MKMKIYLLLEFSRLNYPIDLFEVILVDDDSKERSLKFKFKVSIVTNIGFQIHLKDAIVTAMQIINTDWIITTDADCVVNKTGY
jgi:glycosyltransferase involved in cell wall biosynthesis